MKKIFNLFFTPIFIFILTWVIELFIFPIKDNFYEYILWGSMSFGLLLQILIILFKNNVELKSINFLTNLYFIFSLVVFIFFIFINKFGFDIKNLKFSTFPSWIFFTSAILFASFFWKKIIWKISEGDIFVMFLSFIYFLVENNLKNLSIWFLILSVSWPVILLFFTRIKLHTTARIYLSIYAAVTSLIFSSSYIFNICQWLTSEINIAEFNQIIKISFEYFVFGFLLVGILLSIDLVIGIFADIKDKKDTFKKYEFRTSTEQVDFKYWLGIIAPLILFYILNYYFNFIEYHTLISLSFSIIFVYEKYFYKNFKYIN